MLIDTGTYKKSNLAFTESLHDLHPGLFDIIQKKGLFEGTFNKLAPIMYIADKAQHKYMYFHGSCKQILGYDLEFLTNAGPDFFINLFHHNDYKVYNEKISPEVITFLKKQNEKNYPDFSFSFNYRIKNNHGDYLNMLQRVIFFSLKEDSFPLIEVGIITDITNYKEDSRIIHVIEKAESNINAASPVQLFKSIYFPDRFEGLLSNREKEILKSISEGLSSKEIANKLFISINTIHNHRKNMLQKTHTNNSAELLKYALSNYLL